MDSPMEVPKEDTPLQEEEEQQTEQPQDTEAKDSGVPDGGYGWVIVIAAFMNSLIVDGIIFTFGVMFPEILREFGESKSYTSMVGSVLAGTYLVVGPIVSSLTNLYGCRLIGIIGSIIASLGFIASSFATSVPFLMGMYGIVGGIGFGFVYLPSIVMVQYYFEKKRGFAMGIAVCGSGLGTFVFSPLQQYLIQLYSWKGNLLIQAGIILNCAVFSGLFRPVEENARRQSSTSEGFFQRFRKKKPLLKRIHESRRIAHCDSEDSLSERKRMSVTTATDIELGVFPPENVTSQETDNQLSNGQKTNGNVASQHFTFDSNGGCGKNNNNNRPVKNNSQKRNKSKKLPRHMQRPFYRESIFLSAGSLHNIASYSTARHSQLIEKPNLKGIKGEPMGFKDTLKSSIDFSLMKSASFIVLCVTGFMTFMGFFVPFIYLSDFAHSVGTESTQSAILLSAIGMTNTIGRIFCGWVSDRPEVSALQINNVALVIGGGLTCIVTFLTNYGLQLTYAILFGLSIACFISLRSIILVEFLGVDKLASSFGLLLLFQGTASVIGAPLAGWLYDYTNSYLASFGSAGGLIILSGVLGFPLKCISRWENKGKTENP